MNKRYHANFYTNRLVKEWLKNGKIIIACDLDDTIIPYNEEIKDNCKKMVDLILECQKEGIYFLINTARSKEQLKKAKKQVEELGIMVHGINEMYPEWDKPYGVNGKLYANIFLDDRSGFWDAYWTLSNALTIVTKERKMNMKTFEVNLGVGLNQFFPEKIKIVIDGLGEYPEKKSKTTKKIGRKPKKEKNNESDRIL